MSHRIKRTDLPQAIKNGIRSRKQNVGISVTTEHELSGTWWDGGSRSEYCFIDLVTGRLANINFDHYPGPTLAYGHKVPTVPLCQDDPEKRWAILETGTFCGKDATPRLHVHPDSLPILCNVHTKHGLQPGSPFEMVHDWLIDNNQPEAAAKLAPFIPDVIRIRERQASVLMADSSGEGSGADSPTSPEPCPECDSLTIGTTKDGETVCGNCGLELEPKHPTYIAEHIRTWTAEDFRLDLYATDQRDHRGQTRLAYAFYHANKLVFSGCDFCGSPLHADDSDETLATLLTFLSLRPGDTDREYFDAYTPEQMEFAQQHGEQLSLYSLDLEEGRPGVEEDDDDQEEEPERRIVIEHDADPDFSWLEQDIYDPAHPDFGGAVYPTEADMHAKKNAYDPDWYRDPANHVAYCILIQELCDKGEWHTVDSLGNVDMLADSPDLTGTYSSPDQIADEGIREMVADMIAGCCEKGFTEANDPPGHRES